MIHNTRSFIHNFTLILLLLIPGSIAAQSDSHTISLRWANIHATHPETGAILQTSLHFDAALNFEGSAALPVYQKLFPLDANEEISASLSSFITQEVQETNISSSAFIKNEFTVESGIMVNRGERIGYVRVLPVRKNPLTQRTEVLTRFVLDISRKNIPAAFKASQSNFSGTSVLASGRWYRMNVRHDGIYKLTYSDLQTMGFPVASLNPRMLAVYGNGGGMLPEPNASPRADDLVENSIVVVGEEDGKFDAGDYILFYAQGPDVWTWRSSDSRYVHEKNLYSEVNACFITLKETPGLRVSVAEIPSGTPNRTLTSFPEVYFNEKDLYNLIKTGRQWYGEHFDLQTDMDFPLTLTDVNTSSPVRMSLAVVARSRSYSRFILQANGNTVSQISLAAIPASSLESEYARRDIDTLAFGVSSSQLNLRLTYSKPLSSSEGWLDYYSLNYKRNLIFRGPQMQFRCGPAKSGGNVSRFIIQSLPANTQIWDITDVRKPASVIVNYGTNAEFTATADKPLQYIAFDGSSFQTPELVGEVANQNLHSIAMVDYVIVAYPDFIEEANQLKAMHEANGLNVMVFTPQQIYNEFSGGTQDLTAIRDFMRMLYEKAAKGEEPNHLLLFGDVSYDYLNRIVGNTNMIPTWQSTESLSPVYSYATDDYFGLLDPNEGGNAVGVSDIAMGRLPVSTKAQAQAYINKLKEYVSNSQNVMRDWRNTICFVADDEDNNTHFRQADGMAKYMDTTYRQLNVDKIYMDAYTQVSTPGGQRYPDATLAINQRMESGALIMNYTGHGGELGWAHERVLEISDISSWKNISNMPLFITATCEFSRFDDPQNTSAGELVFLNPKGGGIALFTTTRLTYSSGNETMNKNFFNMTFEKVNGKYRSLGEAARAAKVLSGSDVNGKKFVLLGDPAMRLAFPEYNVATTSINEKPTGSSLDTINALQSVSIAGEIRDFSGGVLSNFNGTIYPVVYDKASEIMTLGNDPGSVVAAFKLRKNIVYKGQTEVIDGRFEFSFIVPKDIEYKMGRGKILYYAASESTDASGFYENIIIGGIYSGVEDDTELPEIRLFMNNINFVDGGITDENPVLIAQLSDYSGINTVGNGIGHDIQAILDGNTKNPYILNDYYKADLGTYKNGSLAYPFFDLSAGEHIVSLTAWDVFNNSATASLKFIVMNSNKMVIRNFYNYPNPFSKLTNFVFEHNQAGNELLAEIQIYDIRGCKVRSIRQTVGMEGYRSDPVAWDGRSDSGHPLGQGIYFYRLVLTGENGQTAIENGKLIIGGN
ncbi:MAG: type IX secretion system sortase PorU [Bacteroidales bacterium]|nr:type IX secretion system sortase PorU [Bacteroidales bacterium]